MSPKHLECGQQAEQLALDRLLAAAKQHKLTLAAQHFLKQHAELRRKPLRFDVVAVTGSAGPGALEWIQDAFQPG